jgi:hypothetical protein
VKLQLGVILVAALVAIAPAQVVRPKLVVMVDNEVWGFNRASFDQEKIVSHGDYQYTPYWDADATLVIARRNLTTNEVQAVRLPYKLTGNQNDGHRNTVVGISPGDGRLHLSFDHHGNNLRYTKSRKGLLDDPPATLTADDFETTQVLTRDAPQQVTYPMFFNDPHGRLYLLYRSGGSGNGRTVLARYESDAAKWQIVARQLLGSEGTYPEWDNSTSRNAYLHDVLFDKSGRLHVAWTYRETGATWASNHDLYYAYSDDGGYTWSNNSGTVICDTRKGETITLDTPGTRVIEIPVYSWLMNQTSLSLDSKNQPHISTYKMVEPFRPDKLEHNPPAQARRNLAFYHYWRTPDGQWHSSEPIRPPGGDGTPIRRSHIFFDPDDTLFLYWSSPQGFRCHSAAASDGWKNWKTFVMTEPKFVSPDASKYDRDLLARKGILSFTADPNGGKEPPGFVILDFALAELTRAAGK